MTRERVQGLMLVLALMVVPLLIIENRATDPTVLLLTWIANLVIWLAFVADYLWGLGEAKDRWAYVRSNWFDLAIILISPPLFVPEGVQGLRSLRALRVLRVGRLGRALRVLRLVRAFGFLGKAWRSAGSLLGKHSFAYIILTCVIFVIGGGALFVLIEGGELDLLDGIWWAVATLTTVGYGDVYPKTDAGRLLALFVILMGLGMMAALTANIAAHFVGSDQKKEQDETQQRLAEIADRLARMERQVAALQEDLHKGVDREATRAYTSE